MVDVPHGAVPLALEESESDGGELAVKVLVEVDRVKRPLLQTGAAPRNRDVNY